MNVFVSWRGSDREIKNTIVSALRANIEQDDTVWESDEGCTSNFSGDCIRAIRNSQVFVVIISDEAMKPSYVINEVIEAHSMEMKGLLNLVIYKITDSELTPEFVANLNHVSDANHVARIYKNNSGIDTLVKRVKELLRKRRCNDPEKPYDVFKPELEGTPLGAPGYFVEHSRDDVIKEISDAFEKSNVVFATQIGGYGRRSAARKYAELHSGEYDNIYMLHLFSGSLRDFFLNGINITNINPNAFDKLSENEIIQRKSALLGKLDRRTLIIVPNLQPDSHDDSFVRDALCAVGCRIIFITESLPRSSFENNSAVSVSRMKSEHLNKLFFHYYDKANDDEREALEPYLNSFFDKIEGHTKAVELTAKTLSGEYGVYPDDIPEILDSIKLDSENRLSNRIFKLISEMFDVKKFNDADKTVLLVASLTAQLPLDEKSFMLILDGCGAPQDGGSWSESIRRLLEHRWLTADSINRTVSLEPFMATVCISKIQADMRVSTICLIHLFERYANSISTLNAQMISVRAKKLSLFFACLGNTEMSDTVELMSKAFDDKEQFPTFDFVKTQLTLEKTRSDAKLTGNEDWFEAVNDFCNYCATLFETLKFYASALLTPGGLTASSSINEQLCDSVEKFAQNLIVNFMDDDYISENSTFEMFINAAKARDLRTVFLSYCSAVNEIVSEADDIDDLSNNAQVEVVILQFIGSQIAVSYPFISIYKKLEFSRACYALRTLLNEFYDDFAEYRFLAVYFDCVCAASASENEAEIIFRELIKSFDRIKGTAFESAVDADDDILYYVSLYISLLIKGERTDEAQRLYRKRVLPMAPASADSAERILNICNSVANSYMAMGDAEECAAFLGMALKARISEIVESHRGGEEYVAAVNTYDMLFETYKLLTSKSGEEAFPESCGEYMDYYRSFPASFADRRTLKKYADIADAALELDFSELADTQLREEIARLKKVASFASGMSPKHEARAFALVSEAGYRVLGYRHHYVQYLGGAALADGKIAEIHNGEGKTYTITLAACFHALCGRQVHILDTSAYLTKRNFDWMRGVFEMLGLKVGFMSNKVCYPCNAEEFAKCDVLYSTLIDDVFVSLRDEISYTPIGLRYDAVIADECDIQMFDNGHTMARLVSSKAVESKIPHPFLIYDFISELPANDENLFEIDNGIITLKPRLIELAENYGFSVREDNNREVCDMLKRCIRSLYIYQNNRDYYIIDGKVKFEDTSTGELYEPKYENAVFICRKEDIAPPPKPERNEISNARSMADFLLGFAFISGTTATASSIKKELKQIYGLDMIAIPPNIPKTRIDYKPRVFAKRQYKLEEILRLVDEHHKTGQPVILITGSISESESFGRALKKAGIEHRLVNARSSEDDISKLISAGELGAVTVTTAMANRGIDILPGGNPSESAFQHLIDSGIPREELTLAIYSPNKTSPEQAALYDKYKAMLSFYRNKTEDGRKAVLSLGGICVIGTECFDDLRTEQQLRGRAGRQGAPGESYVMYSLEDTQLKNLLGTSYEMASRAYLSLGDAAISIDYLNNTIDKARGKLHFRIAENRFKIPDLLFCSDARKVVIGMLLDVRSGKYDPHNFMVDWYFSLPENKEAIRAVTKGKTTENAVINKIFPLIADRITKTNDKALAALFAEGVYINLANVVECAVNGDIYEAMRLYVVSELAEAWTMYLQQMEAVVAQYDTYNTSKKITDMLLKRSKAEYTSLLQRIVPRML